MEVKRTQGAEGRRFEVVRPPGGQGEYKPTLEEENNRLSAMVAQMSGRIRQQEETEELSTTVALFLREHYQEEIRRGLHAGKNLGEIVTHYLGRERAYHCLPWHKLIWMVLTGRRFE